MIGTVMRAWLTAAGITVGMALTAPVLAQDGGVAGLRVATGPRTALLLGNINYVKESRLDAVAFDILDMELLLKDLGFHVVSKTDLDRQKLYAAATIELPKLLEEAENELADAADELSRWSARPPRHANRPLPRACTNTWRQGLPGVDKAAVRPSIERTGLPLGR